MELSSYPPWFQCTKPFFRQLQLSEFSTPLFSQLPLQLLLELNNHSLFPFLQKSLWKTRLQLHIICHISTCSVEIYLWRILHICTSSCSMPISLLPSCIQRGLVAFVKQIYGIYYTEYPCTEGSHAQANFFKHLFWYLERVFCPFYFVFCWNDFGCF